MKRYPIGFAVAAMMVVGSSTVLAHEECDDLPAAVAEPAKQLDATVTIKLFQYQPGRLQIRPGTTVIWVNEDEIFHTVTLDGKAGSFDAPLDGKGKSFTFTFNQPGTYGYHCDRHEHMRGEIAVR